jgi:two-component system response regulator CpxR
MQKFKVLLIDDEEELVSALVERLSYRGIGAAYALDGYEALLKLRQEKFEVVVLDVKLPGMDGMEVLSRINREHPDVPVLLITGHGSPADHLAEIPEGACACLAKPINIEDLIAKMEEAISNK